MLKQACKWLLLFCLCGGFAGLSSAFFLHGLAFVTDARTHHHSLLLGLPFFGLFIGWLYHRFGQGIEQGHALILQEIKTPTKPIPLKMAFLVFSTSLMTHLVGGSSGREGVAVQMSGALSDQLRRWVSLSEEERKLLLVCAVSAGFGAIFGTPIAGAIFGWEVASAYQNIWYILPCLLVATIAHLIAGSCGITHSIYLVPFIPPLSTFTFISSVILGTVCGIVALWYNYGMTWVCTLFMRYVSYPPYRPFLGGLALVIMLYPFATSPYVGLGLPTLSSAFQTPLHGWAWLAKMGATWLTLGSGFKGGDVTPLFFVGATLGNMLSSYLSLPLPVLVGLGFTCVFSSVYRVPITGFCLSVSLFGLGIAPLSLVALLVGFCIQKLR